MHFCHRSRALSVHPSGSGFRPGLGLQVYSQQRAGLHEEDGSVKRSMISAQAAEGCIGSWG
jgi:hypothetical protein